MRRNVTVDEVGGAGLYLLAATMPGLIEQSLAAYGDMLHALP